MSSSSRGAATMHPRAVWSPGSRRQVLRVYVSRGKGGERVSDVLRGKIPKKRIPPACIVGKAGRKGRRCSEVHSAKRALVFLPAGPGGSKHVAPDVQEVSGCSGVWSSKAGAASKASLHKLTYDVTRHEEECASIATTLTPTVPHFAFPLHRRFLAKCNLLQLCKNVPGLCGKGEPGDGIYCKEESPTQQCNAVQVRTSVCAHGSSRLPVCTTRTA